MSLSFSFLTESPSPFAWEQSLAGFTHRTGREILTAKFSKL